MAGSEVVTDRSQENKNTHTASRRFFGRPLEANRNLKRKKKLDLFGFGYELKKDLTVADEGVFCGLFDAALLSQQLMNWVFDVRSGNFGV